MKKGLFIAVEGMDGSGSTTQCKKLVAYLSEKKQQTFFTHEPSALETGLLLRKYLDSQRNDQKIVSHAFLGLLFAADRIFHYQNEILPKLEQGIWVVSDRYVLSSLVYQGMDLELEWLRSLNCKAPAADLTIIVDADDHVAAERRHLRRGKVEIFDDLASQSIIRRRYLELAHLVEAKVIDGNGEEDAVF